MDEQKDPVNVPTEEGTSAESQDVSMSTATEDANPSASKKPLGDRSARRRRGPMRKERESREFEQTILDLARVTRVTKGGKRMRFRASLVIGDKKGRVGFGVAKGADVQVAVQKAYHQAKRNVVTMDLVNGSFPHAQEASFGAADVLLKPAPSGTGIKAGGAMRLILELAGVSDAVGKILRGKNKINIAKATFGAIALMRVPSGVLTDKEQVATQRKHARSKAAERVRKTSSPESSERAEPSTT